MVRVTTGGRLHFGFQNLSLAHARLYGGVGVTLSEPRVVVEAHAADDVVCDHPVATRYAREAAAVLGVLGARVIVHEELPRHVGLGSGTQLALATLQAVAAANGQAVSVRDVAPRLGRGGRSGIGVAGFESGGFVLDAGHPTERFTTDRPADGEWDVPAVAAHHEIPADWRFVVVIPDLPSGRSGANEDDSIRTVVEDADPGIADDIAAVVARRVLPAMAEGDWRTFGAAVATISRLNGAWYADEQGGVFRPPLGEIVNRLTVSGAVSGAGQSSWGPAVFGVTDRAHAPAARAAAREILDSVGVGGSVVVSAGRNAGATVETE
ncbi:MULTISPECIES: beta-ribofuranosylaminobenzene 5'-phosphate synthase family protein [unclassified Haladaptatus]|uniref:beta-ribofuranosylaminobenzene 5'-phosphate synthase family protein n=1 Tax=unclassified Haladaptatus TaxID=2622732 RepID=UPI0023E7A20A|nr:MULTISPECIES: beta-ribofuranosylaminobenzene 5'-phosphate synthase family protein [unclassified Haladaptatus]